VFRYITLLQFVYIIDGVQDNVDTVYNDKETSIKRGTAEDHSD
jgi:hypothetical protein